MDRHDTTTPNAQDDEDAARCYGQSGDRGVLPKGDAEHASVETHVGSTHDSVPQRRSAAAFAYLGIDHQLPEGRWTQTPCPVVPGWASSLVLLAHVGPSLQGGAAIIKNYHSVTNY